MKQWTWSYSRLKNYELCPNRYLHYDVLKDFADVAGAQTNEGLDAHKAYEQRIKLGTKLPLGLAMHEPIMLRLEGLPGQKYPEQKLALTAKFKQTGYFSDDVWFRTVIDFCVIDGHVAGLVDYKTGKPSSDPTQLKLMSATIMLCDQSIERVNARLLFMNHGRAESASYTRDDLPEIWAGILPRVKRMQNDHDFVPKPNGLCIRFCAVTSCPFHGRGSRS